MAGVKLVGRIESLYKVRTILILSFMITVLLATNYLRTSYLPNFIPNMSDRFLTFFSNNNLPSLYGTLVGLLLAAYAVLVALIPNFSFDSLQQPIFGQVNRLFLFTIFVGIIMMIINFAGNLIPDTGSPLFEQIEVFFFISLMTGLIFCVLSLSDLFKLLRKRGARR